MKMKWIHLIIAVKLYAQMSFTASLAVENGGSEHRNCSLGFTQHHIVNTYSSKTICAKIYPEEETWFHARDRCSLDFSYLTHRYYYNSTFHTHLVNEGIDVLWVGIHRRANFFVTENPSKVFREVSSISADQWGYHWSQNEPGHDNCVVLNVSTGSLHTRDCTSRLPFVCDDDGKGVTSSLIAALSCPDRWVVSVSLSTSSRTCISNTYERLSYIEAEKTCSASKGRLANSEEFNILSSRENSYDLKDGRYWIEGTGRNDENDLICLQKIVKSALNVNKTTYRNCSLQAKFICVKRFEFQNIGVQVSPDVIKPEPSYSSNSTDLLFCAVKSKRGDSKIQGEIIYQWYKDEIPIFFQSYVLRMSFSDDSLNRDMFKWNNATRQGYYHCEVRFAGSTKFYSSPKVKFCYSDIVTYVVDIHGIEPQSITDYSKREFYNTYIKAFDDTTMSNVVTNLQSLYPTAEWDFKNISMHKGDAAVEIVVYIHRTDVDIFDDRLICEEVEEAFGEHYSIPADMNISRNITFIINCKDFPVTTAYRLTKSLNAVKQRIKLLEETEIEILQELKTLQDSVNMGSSPREEDLDPDFLYILKSIQEMNRLEKERRKIQVNQIADNTFGEREVNPFDGVPSERKPIYLGSETTNKFGFIGTNGQPPRPRGIMSVQDKKLYYFPSENAEGSLSERKYPEEPLIGRIYPKYPLPERFYFGEYPSGRNAENPL